MKPASSAFLQLLNQTLLRRRKRGFAALAVAVGDLGFYEFVPAANLNVRLQDAFRISIPANVNLKLPLIIQPMERKISGKSPIKRILSYPHSARLMTRRLRGSKRKIP